MKIFENRKTEKMFFNKIQELGTKEAQVFSSEVVNFFEKKGVSKDGDYSKFKIDSSDLKRIELDMELEDCEFCEGTGEYPRANGPDDCDMVKCFCTKGCGYDEVDNTV